MGKVDDIHLSHPKTIAELLRDGDADCTELAQRCTRKG
jgi:hypothetical protein